MFNLSTLSGINLKTDNYFQYTSQRPCVSIRTQGRFALNAPAFPSSRKGDTPSATPQTDAFPYLR